MKIIEGFKKIPWNSIRVKVVVVLVIILLPLLFFLVYNSYYSINVIHNQVANSHRNLLSLYMQQVDTGLDDIEGYLIRLTAFNDNFKVLEESYDSYQYRLAKIGLFNDVKEDIISYNYVNSIFFYSLKNNKLFNIYNNTGTFSENQNINSYLNQLLGSKSILKEINKSNWYYKEIDNNYYLFRIINYRDAYIGAWININRIEVPLNLIDIGEKGRSFFVTCNGTPMMEEKINNSIEIRLNQEDHYITGREDEFLVVTKKSNNGSFSLVVLIPNEKILQKLPYLQYLITIVVIISLILLPVSILLVKLNVINPLNKILNVMKKVKENGDLYKRVEDDDLIADEFQVVNATFNNMMDNIQKLRIDVYEEKLAKQRFELRNLQLQVKPHFFLNTLNIIYSLSKTNNNKKIQEMIQLLVQYFRYMFRSDMDMVLLKNEVEHVKNYIQIQQIRFPETMEYIIEIDDDIIDISVPPLILQTFVENIIKHAVKMDQMVYFEIIINNLEGERCVQIIIKDNGTGFPESLLLEINSIEDMKDNSGEHIGIYNVKQRLNLVYGDDASIRFSNDPDRGGAVIKIIIPYN